METIERIKQIPDNKLKVLVKISDNNYLIETVVCELGSRISNKLRK